MRLTVAQALVRFLAVQYSERDGERQRLIPGCFGIFGHGNVAGIGQALLQAHATGEAELPYYLARNEQAMVHAACGYARMRDRLQTLACTTSIGPGRDEHGHRGRAGHHQPAAGAAAARRRVRHPGRGGAAAGARAAGGARDQRQRRLPARQQVLRPHRAPRAVAAGPARRDAHPDRPGRDRRGHPRAAAGRAGRGLRLARGTVRRAHLARAAGRAGRGRAGPGRRGAQLARAGRCWWPAAGSRTPRRRRH